jgi:arsenite methyltransferase
MMSHSKEDIHAVVRSAYAQLAQSRSTCCGPNAASPSKNSARSLGYSEEDLSAAPDNANLGLASGNPTAFDTLKEGEIVVDLGAGAGLDAFIAARKVGKSGRVIGV